MDTLKTNYPFDLRVSFLYHVFHNDNKGNNDDFFKAFVNNYILKKYYKMKLKIL